MMIDKRLFKLLLVILVFILNQARSQDPNAYLGNLSNEFKKISEDMMSYISAVNHGKSARKVERRRAEVINQLKESERTVRKMTPFNGDRKLRDSTANYFRISNIVMNRDYGKIMDLEDIAEQSYDAMEAYLKAKDIAQQRIEMAFDAADKEFDTFAVTNKIKIIESSSKLSKRLEIASKVNDYYNTMYLTFFKSYKNEIYLLDAMNAGNVGAIEQTRNALLNSSSADLPKLGPMVGYNGDVSLKNGLQELLSFYKSEATKIPGLIDYYLAKEKMEKIKKTFDALKSNEKTKEEIDNYNKAINDLNVKAKSANQINDELNKRRSYLLKYWNEATNTFLDKHTPK